MPRLLDIRNLPYRWRYVLAVGLIMLPAAVGSAIVDLWLFWVGVVVTLAAIVAVAVAQERWLWSVTESTLAMRGIDSTVRLASGGSADEARLALAINHLADVAVAALQSDELNQRYHESILDSIRDGVLVADGDGHLLYSNSAAQEIFAFDGTAASADSDSPPGPQHLGAKVNAIEIADAVERCVATGSDVSCEVAMFNPPRHLAAKAVPISAEHSDGDAGVNVLVVVRDVTDERRQSDSLNEFIANASHELRTPITVVKASVETLKLGGKLSGAEAEFVDRIEAGAGRMEELVNDLLDLTMLETGISELRVAPVMVAELLRRTCDELRPVADRQGVELEVAEVGNTLCVSADAAELQRALANLLSNAIKFSSRGDSVRVAAEASGDELLITVADAGRGIEPESLPHIFDRFYRTRSDDGAQPGFGLGLAIVRNLVELHGGTVDVESTLGVGSTFTVRLPSKS